MEIDESTNPTETNISLPVDGSTEQTMSNQEKVCVGVALAAITAAIMNATGLIMGLPEFVATAVKTYPGGAFFVMAIFTVLITATLASLVPKAVKVVILLPACSFVMFWLNAGWSHILQKNETITEGSIVLIHLATLIFGFCLASHSTLNGRKPLVSERFIILMMFALAANLASLFITACVTSFM